MCVSVPLEVEGKVFVYLRTLRFSIFSTLTFSREEHVFSLSDICFAMAGAAAAGSGVGVL